MGRGGLPLALLAAAVLGAGCGERSEPVGDLRQSYPVSVRGAGDRPTVVTQTPARIVALDPGAAELVAALVERRRLVGVPAGLATPGATEVVRLSGQVKVEAVTRLEPDLIVATPSTDPIDVSRAQRESGAAVYIQPAGSIDEIERGALELGFLLGEAPAARRIVGRIRRAVAKIEDEIAKIEPVSVFIDTGFFITVPQRSLLGSLVAAAEGESVAGPTPGPGPFPLDELARLDPDVYLTTTKSGVTLASLRRNPATRSLTAVREGRVAVVSLESVTWPGPRISEGLQEIAAALHPDAFR